MKKKTIIIIGIIVLMVSGIMVFGISIESGENVDNNIQQEGESEIEPEEEIPELSNYEVKLTLYYEDKKSGVLTKEERIVNAKNLLDNPYMFTLNELLKGPSNQELQKTIPEGTKINNTIIDGRTLIVDVSKEFQNASGMNAIYSIVNTMTEFNEIENVKITIDGEEKSEFKEKFVRF